MRARLYWPVVIAAAALVGLLTYGVVNKGTDTSIDQGSLSDYKGKVVVMNFWASWCPPCVQELPLLERTQKSLQSRNATVLGVNIQDATEDAMGYVKRFDLT
jgi:cytochrome c biogenesis protein CcmG/thiol:disulfide interchange protein DsbE